MRIEMKMMKNFILAAILLASFAGFAVQAQAQAKANPIPSIVQKDGRYALMVDGAPYLMLGMQTNNSSDWPATLPQVWPAAEALHVNTVETPIYWEQFEPKPGQFDYSQIDTVLAQARAHHVHLVLLWFGTWKNGSQHYMPEWMKLEPEKYSHVINKRGEPVDSPSPFAQASLDADIHAFTAFMKHLKTADPERTVLMVQVENETGTWGTLRDYSPQAEKLFAAPVPADVLKAMNVIARIAHSRTGRMSSARGRGELPCLGYRPIRWTDRRGGQGSLSAAALCQRRAARSAQAGRAGQL